MARTFASGEYVDIAHYAGIDNDNEWTIAFRWKSSLNAQWEVVGKHQASGSRDGFGFEAQPSTPNYMGYYAKRGLTQVAGLSVTSINATDGNWHSCAARLSRVSGGSNEMYVDGVSSGVATNSDVFGNNTDPLRIGASIDGFWARYVGDVADFAYWSVQLTADEMKAYCAGEVPGAIRPTALRIWLPLRN